MPTPTLAAEEYQYLDAGVKLNGGSALPFVDVVSVDGLDSAPLRSQFTEREGEHGAWIDAEFESSRTVTIEGIVYASPTALETYLDSLKANYAPQTSPQLFYFGTDAGTRAVLGKSLGLRYAKDRARSFGSVPIQIQIACEDPRIYTPNLVTQSIPGTLVLNGNRDTVGTITINGPRTNPTITIGDTTFTFALTLVSGESVVIDLNRRTVLKGSTNVRNSMTLTGNWPKLQPGANVFTVGGTGAGTITVSARSAWR
jgi:phage-related protein